MRLLFILSARGMTPPALPKLCHRSVPPLLFQVVSLKSQESLETVSKILLEDLAADPRQLQIVERPMDRWQFVVSNLQSSRLPDPRQRPLYDPADLAQPAPVGRSRPRQVVLDPSPLEPLAITWRSVLPVAVQSIRPTASATARLSDQRNVVEQRHRQE